MHKENTARLGFALGGALFTLVSIALYSRIKRNKGGDSKQEKRRDGYLIGVDIGGTKIACGLVDTTGRVLSDEIVMLKEKDTESVCELIEMAIKSVLSKTQIKINSIDGIGIGFPGSIDNEKGIIRKVSNFPTWNNVPLAQLISQRLNNRPVFLENDAKAAVLAEMWVGAAKDPSIKDMVMLTIGTGIGGAIVINGKIVRGTSDMAGEIGHSIIDVNGRQSETTGVKGILEKYASGPAIRERAIEAYKKSEKAESIDLSKLTTHDVFKNALEGDVIAKNIVEQTYEFLGVTCINVSRFLDPQLIVLTGGITEVGDPFFEGVRAAYKKHHWQILPINCQIVPSAVHNQAGFIGAAGCAKLSVFGYLKD